MLKKHNKHLPTIGPTSIPCFVKFSRSSSSLSSFTLIASTSPLLLAFADTRGVGTLPDDLREGAFADTFGVAALADTLGVAAFSDTLGVAAFADTRGDFVGDSAFADTLGVAAFADTRGDSLGERRDFEALLLSKEKKC